MQSNLFDCTRTLQLIAANRYLLQRQLLKIQGKSLSKSYTPELRSFALNLNFLSPKAYCFARGKFNSCLPHSRTIANWYTNTRCKPGFTQESFDAVKKAVIQAKELNEKIYLNISFDEMAIRQLVEWNSHKQQATGYVDIGDGGETNVLATQVFVNRKNIFQYFIKYTYKYFRY